jgi:hypothetical protein
MRLKRGPAAMKRRLRVYLAARAHRAESVATLAASDPAAD